MIDPEALKEVQQSQAEMHKNLGMYVLRFLGVYQLLADPFFVGHKIWTSLDPSASS